MCLWPNVEIPKQWQRFKHSHLKAFWVSQCPKYLFNVLGWDFLFPLLHLCLLMTCILLSQASLLLQCIDCLCNKCSLYCYYGLLLQCYVIELISKGKKNKKNFQVYIYTWMNTDPLHCHRLLSTCDNNVKYVLKYMHISHFNVHKHTWMCMCVHQGW